MRRAIMWLAVVGAVLASAFAFGGAPADAQQACVSINVDVDGTVVGTGADPVCAPPGGVPGLPGVPELPGLPGLPPDVPPLPIGVF